MGKRGEGGELVEQWESRTALANSTGSTARWRAPERPGRRVRALYDLKIAPATWRPRAEALALRRDRQPAAFRETAVCGEACGDAGVGDVNG
jgi:hypothetical protein